MFRVIFHFALAISLFGCEATPDDNVGPVSPNGSGSQSVVKSPAKSPIESKLDYVVPDRQLSASDAAKLASTLSDDDGNVKARVDLLWHYRNQFADPAASASANSHLLWLVQYHPDAKVLGTPIAEVPTLPGDPTVGVFSNLWNKQATAHNQNARVQGNAGQFYKSIDADRSLRFLEHALALDGNEPAWLESLGDLYAARAKADSVYTKWRSKAIDAYSKSLRLLKSDGSKQQLLPKLARVQLKAGKLEACEKSADALADLLINKSKDSSDTAVSSHSLHVIRGLISLQRGDTELGERELDHAAKAIASQQVSLWQLDLSLADQLQTRKRWLPVLNYLEVAKNATRDRIVTRWIATLRRSESADLSAYVH